MPTLREDPRHHLSKWATRDVGLLGIRVGMSTGTRQWHHQLGDQVSRRDMIWCFSPGSNERRDTQGRILTPGEREIDILITTDGLSEGANLQDCRFLVNYDLPWNPMRIVQRVGRID